MDPIIRSIKEDRHAGLQSDPDGRVWFRQRRVRFTTIRFRPEDLLSGGWGGFQDPLPPLSWDPPPELPALRAFSAEASRRFLTLWYRCIDVMVARSLFGRDRAIFQVPFFEGGLFSDTGIAEAQPLSAVPPELHGKILADYADGRQSKTRHSIHFLSAYLEGITDDLREALAPLHALWREEDLRMELLEEPARLCAMLEARLRTRSSAGLLIDGLLEQVDLRLHSLLDVWHSRLREIGDAALRQLIHRQKSEGNFAFEMRERRSLIESARATGLSPEGIDELRDGLDLIDLPSTLERALRRTFYYATRSLHESILLLRRPDSLTAREKAAAVQDRLKETTEALSSLVADVENRHLLRRLDRLAAAWSSGAGLSSRQLLTESQTEAGKSAEEETVDSPRLLRRLVDLPERLAEIDGRILAFHRDQSQVDPFREDGPSAVVRDGDRAPDSGIESNGTQASLWFPPHWNPARDQVEVLDIARRILAERLRVVRRTASDYSLRPGDRHGILTLNPVLRLWKERPVYEKGLPPVAAREINTPDVVQCLIDLASLADPDLGLREIHSGRLVRERHGIRNLARLRFFLIPGSCAPVREVDRQDFPEFRNRVIGEKRTPIELGIEREEGILTGGWYRKQTHTLYYPVGGDNAGLLSTIWKAGRTESVAAFFFALGQFVHDCFEDRLIYYRLGEPTFREAVEDYYRFYEKMRRTRDERSGRRRADNSRAGVRFLFAVFYSRLLMEALTGANQGAFRHGATEDWFSRNTKIPLLAKADRSTIRALREQVRSTIEQFNA